MNIKLFAVVLIFILCFSTISAALGTNYNANLSADNRSNNSSNTENVLKTASIQNNTTIYVDIHGNDNNSGTSDAPKRSIKNAIKTVKENGQIIIISGQYHENNITINKSVSIIGQNTTIDGDGSLIFTILKNRTVSMQNLFITNGNGVYGGAIINEGTLNIEKSSLIKNNANLGTSDSNKGSAGALLNKGQAVIKQTSFRENTALTDGGAVVNYANASLELKDCEFADNKADKGGAAIVNWNVCNINNCGFINNKILYSNGGAIYNNKDLKINNSIFNKNTGKDHGGSIYNTANCTIDNCQLNNNFATNGGAISSTGELRIDHTNFQNNVARGSGGAVFNINRKCNITNSNFNSNKAETGGCIINYNDPDNNFKGTIYLLNNSFNNNKATQGGVLTNLGPGKIENNSFDNNSADFGGAIMNQYSDNIEMKYNNFIHNKGTYYGGAIYNIGTITFERNNFTMNKITTTEELVGTKASGGAIYNENGTLYINDGNEFFFNTVNNIVMGNDKKYGGGLSNIGLGNVFISGEGTFFIDSGIYNTGYLSMDKCKIEENTNNALINENEKSFEKSDNTVICPSNHSIHLRENFDSIHIDGLHDSIVYRGDNVNFKLEPWLEHQRIFWMWYEDMPAYGTIRVTIYDKKKNIYQTKKSTDVNGNVALSINTADFDPGTYVIQAEFKNAGLDNEGYETTASEFIILPKK